MPSARLVIGAVDALFDRASPPAATWRRWPRRSSWPRPPIGRRGRFARRGPARSASAASIIRPVRQSSIALALPIARVIRCEPPHAGHDAELDFRLAEFGGLGGDDEIAHHRDSQPPPSAKPATAAIVGLRTRARRCQSAMKSATQGLTYGLRLHLLDVGARGKGLGRAGDDDER